MISRSRITVTQAFAALTVLLALAAFTVPQEPFSIDDVLYIDMARAMAERGAFDVTEQNLPDGAPLLTRSATMVHVIDGRAIPQYPGGYAILAAPFYILFGVQGLILMNALAAGAALWLTHRITQRLYDDDAIARNACLLLGFATIFAGYVFGIWPQMLSLAFTLGGALFTLNIPGEKKAARLVTALCAGVVFGLGLNFRIDAIVPAAAAFFWLRLYAAPDDRTSAAALLAGLAPSVLMAAVINDMKFGVFLPFYYGEKGGLDSAGSYGPVAWAIATAITASLVLDVSKPAVQRIIKPFLTVRAVLALTAGVFLLLVFSKDALRLARNAYFLIVDIQAFDGANQQLGLARDDYGYWSFWGMPKKALIESLPFAALMIIPVLEFFKGRKLRAHAFSLLMIAAPLAFFSLKGMHGGMGYNMRYFLPVMPFIAILSAYGLHRVMSASAARPKLLTYGCAAGVAAAIALYQSAASAPAALQTPLQLYPQLALFAAVLGACAFALIRGKSAPALLLSGAAFGYAAVLSVADAAGYLSFRAAKTPYARSYQALIPQRSLVLTTAEDYLMRAAGNDVAAVRPDEDDPEKTAAAVSAYETAGRCVFVHSALALEHSRLMGFESVAIPYAHPRDRLNPTLALYAPANRPKECR